MPSSPQPRIIVTIVHHDTRYPPLGAASCLAYAAQQLPNTPIDTRPRFVVDEEDLAPCSRRRVAMCCCLKLPGRRPTCAFRAGARAVSGCGPDSWRSEHTVPAGRFGLHARPSTHRRCRLRRRRTDLRRTAGSPSFRWSGRCDRGLCPPPGRPGDDGADPCPSS